MEFIFENPWLIVILIGALSSMFGGSRGEKKKERKPVQSPKRYQPPLKEERKIETRPNTPRQERTTKREEILKPESVANQPSSSRKEGFSRLNKPRNKPLETRKKQVIQTDHILEGIIWSEILNQPKSKRQSRSRMRNS